jgi:hypothetical protein
LTVTSASGTSSADLKGEKGDKGDKGDSIKGDKGDTGAAGVSVSSVKQTTTSSADGGSNVVTVTLSNGATSTFTVKNGSKGSSGTNGKTPVRGTDYWTDADQEAIVQQVIAALGTPVFGRVDADNNIILTGELADGTYTLKYEDAEGNVTTIGTLEHDADAPSYTNLLYTYDVDRDKRFSKSSDAVDLRKDGLGVITVVIPFADMMGKTLRIKAPHILDQTPAGYRTSFDAVDPDDNHMGYVFNSGDRYMSSATCAVYEGNDTYSFLFTDENVTAQYNAIHFMHATIVVNTTGTAVTDEELSQIVITIDEPIV